MGDGRLNGTAGSVEHEAGPPPVHDCTRVWGMEMDGIWPLPAASRARTRASCGAYTCVSSGPSPPMFEGKAVECTAHSAFRSLYPIIFIRMVSHTRYTLRL